MQQETIDIPVLKHQRDFINSNATHTGLVAGFGAGKSKAATVKCLSKKMQYPGFDVAYYLPTYGLIKDIAVPNFKELLNQMEIPFTYHQTDKNFTTPYGRIILRSMENTDTIVGYETVYSLIDEADILPKKKMRTAFIKIVARNRKKTPDGTPNAIDLVSTPEGFNFLYDFFVKENKPNRVMIKAKTSDNPYLSETYLETLRDIYSHEELEAYTNGEFVNLTSGNVYYKFNRKKNHSDREIQPRDVLHIGMDFNITNMSAVIHVTDGRRITAVEEITKAYDTSDMINVINQRYSKHSIVVYPDASGQNRKTSASDTDISLLKKAKLKVKVDSRNPSVRDRITKVNAAFENAKGETSYYVNTNNCPEYTESLEKLPYKNGLPDKESGYDHLPDGAGYCVFQLKKTNFSPARAR